MTFLSEFYFKIDRHISLVKGYTEIKELPLIIKMCRLKPLAILTNGNYNINLHRNWIDEFGNSLKVLKKNRVKIILNDLSIEQKNISTDLYAGLSLNKTLKISKLSYLFSSKDIKIISMLGIDNHLRSFIYNGEWKSYPSLYLGMKVLRSLAKNSDIKYFKEMNPKDLNIFGSEEGEAWLTSLPEHNDFDNELLLNIKQERDND